MVHGGIPSKEISSEIGKVPMKSSALALIALLGAGCGDGLYFDLAGPTAAVSRDGALDDRTLADDEFVSDQQSGGDVEVSTTDVSDANPTDLIEIVDGVPDTAPLVDLPDSGDESVMDVVTDTVDAFAPDIRTDIVDASETLDTNDVLIVDVSVDRSAEDVSDAGSVDVSDASDVLTDISMADALDVMDVSADLVSEAATDVGTDAPSMDASADVPADFTDASAVDVRDTAEEEAPPPQRVRILFNHAASGVPMFTGYFGTYAGTDPSTGWTRDFCEGGVRSVIYNGAAGWSECDSVVPSVHGRDFLFKPDEICQTSCDVPTFRFFRFEYQGIMYSGESMTVLQRAAGVGPVPGYPYYYSLRFLFPS